MAQELDDHQLRVLGPAAALEIIRQRARETGGKPSALSDRAAAYRELYAASAGNFVFPLLAAHGALWGKSFLPASRRAALGLAQLDLDALEGPASRMSEFDAFVRRFNNIHLEVYAEAFTVFHFTRLFPDDTFMDNWLPGALRADFRRIHDAAARKERLPIVALREVYERYFRWEQEAVVAPLVQEALAGMRWPMAKRLARRPVVRFSYFPLGWAFLFSNFMNPDERVRRGLAAFDMGARLDFDWVEKTLVENRRYPAPVRSGRAATLPAGRPNWRPIDDLALLLKARRRHCAWLRLVTRDA